MVVILPMIAVLSVTAEWSQRSGLTTFTLVPHRGRVVLAKAIGVVAIAIVSMLVAFLVGALGNILGSAVHGAPIMWDQGVVDLLYLLLGNTLLVMVGLMLGVLIRGSAGALVAYFLYAFVAPTPPDLPRRRAGVVPRPAAVGRPELPTARTPCSRERSPPSSGPSSERRRWSGS